MSRFHYQLFSFSLIFLLSAGVKAQDIPVIQTDRPDQTECPYVVPPGYFQAEAGFNYEHANESEENFLYPTVLLRYGVNAQFEFRLITEWAATNMAGDRISGLNPVRVGFKAILCKENGVIPQTAFLGELILPDVASRNLRSAYYAPTFRFSMSHTLSNRVSLGYNLGAEWDGLSPEPSFIYTMTGAFSLSEKIDCYGEFYGYFPQLGKPDHRADAGMSFFLSNNTMLDISGGFGITPNAPDYYGSIGFSFRLPR